MSNSKREEVKKLIAKRDQFEAHIHSNKELLKSLGADMNTELVDSEGYPVAGIDIATIRQSRHEIICRINDLKQITADIDKGLLELHEEGKSANTVEGTIDGNEKDAKYVHRTSNRPFAIIKKVIAGSPADLAGLMENDQVVQFGSLHADTFVNIKQMFEIVCTESDAIRTTVVRHGKPHRLTLVPQLWSGLGRLGCSVLSLLPPKII